MSPDLAAKQFRNALSGLVGTMGLFEHLHPANSITETSEDQLDTPKPEPQTVPARADARLKTVALEPAPRPAPIQRTPTLPGPPLQSYMASLEKKHEMQIVPAVHPSPRNRPVTAELEPDAVNVSDRLPDG